MLLTNISLEHSRQTAERIRLKVYDLKIPHLFNESVATNVTISIGIAIFEDEDVEGALEKARPDSQVPAEDAELLQQYVKKLLRHPRS